MARALPSLPPSLPFCLFPLHRWLQIAHDYISGAGGKSMADGIDPDDLLEAFHGVNPMCAMPSALSSALPLPGPAGAAASPTTPPP